MLGVATSRLKLVRVVEERQRRRRALSGPPEGRHAFRPASASLLLADSLRVDSSSFLDGGRKSCRRRAISFLEALSLISFAVSSRGWVPVLPEPEFPGGC